MTLKQILDHIDDSNWYIDLRSYMDEDGRRNDEPAPPEEEYLIRRIGLIYDSMAGTGRDRELVEKLEADMNWTSELLDEVATVVGQIQHECSAEPVATS